MTQVQKQGSQIGGSIPTAAKQAYLRYGGMRGLYGSFLTRICRSSWYSLVTLLIMDACDALPEHMKM